MRDCQNVRFSLKYEILLKISNFGEYLTNNVTFSPKCEIFNNKYLMKKGQFNINIIKKLSTISKHKLNFSGFNNK